jgi:hypothetical protein
MVAVRILSDGRRVVRTSIDLDEEVYYAAKEARLPLSSLFNTALLDYFGASSIDDDILRIREMRKSVTKVAEIARLKEENAEKRQQLATAAVRDRAESVREIERLEADAKIADAEALEAHRRKLRDTWLVLEKKKRIFCGQSLFNRLPENDADMVHEGYWSTLARDISKIAGEDYTAQEVISYARQQVAVL